jgi:ABC-type sugar transport system ATPase subunit
VTAIEARGIVVRFGGVAALDGVDLELTGGRVHALLGENGAGKSTLMKTLSGAIVPDDGMIAVGGHRVVFSGPRDAIRAGIRMVHQELSLVPALSVTENVLLGAEGIRRTMRQRAVAALERIGSRLDPDARVETLSLADRQMVEIAKALALPRTRVLILDEPTAILSPRECDALFACLAQLTAAGIAVLYCTHRLDEVAQVAQDVTVLRDGRLVASGAASDFPRDTIVRHMIGRDVTREARTPISSGAIALAVRNLSTGFVHDVTFDVRYGEIVGLVGLVGAGRTELVRAIVGAAPIDGGTLTLDDGPFRARQPRDAVRKGFGFVPEDRKGTGLVMGQSVRANMTLARLSSFARAGIVEPQRERRAADEWIERLRIKARSAEIPVERLSGGNQQKVVLARWLLGDLKVLIVDEPTRGVDVGARAEIYRIVKDLAAAGTAILVVTSDLGEAAELCDRLVVMREGRLLGEAGSPARAGAMMVGA